MRATIRKNNRPSRRPSATLGAIGASVAVALTLAACGTSTNHDGLSTGSTPTSTAVPKHSSSTGSKSLSSALASLERPPAGRVALTEDGSSLLYPLYLTWAAAFSKVDRSFSSTAGADGSGTGIADAENNTTTIGASDAYLPPATTTQYPTIENIPVAISAQMIDYNIPGIAAGTHLRLDGAVIAGIYEGSITNWDASQIAALNKGIKLPDLRIVPLHRSDSSGDSFLFTSYLADSDAKSFAAKQGASTSPTFPSVSGALAEKGNSGMVAGCAATAGCIAYIGISYKADIEKAKLGEAMLQNKSGNFELPDKGTIHAEAAGFSGVPATGTLSLIYGSAATGYPIINYEYIIVKTDQPSATTAAGIKAFLAWAIDPGHGNAAKYLDTVGFQPLPAGALGVSIDLLERIS